MRRILHACRRRIVTLSVFLCFYLLTSSLSAVAQSPRLVPAQFSFQNRLFEIEISPNDVPRNAALVRCQGVVEIDGTLTNYHCVTGEVLFSEGSRSRSMLSGSHRRRRQRRRIAAHRDLLTAVINAVSEQEFIPALVDGVDVRVLMNFSVLINCSSDACATIPMPNHGYSFREYGYTYTSPQPILDRDDWYQGFQYKLEWIQSWMPNISQLDRWNWLSRIPYVMSVAVDTDGVAYDGCLNAVESGWYINQGRFQRRLERAVDTLSAVKFIPGFHDNEPAPMRFYESSVADYDRSSRVEGPFLPLRCRQVSVRNDVE